MTPSPRRYVDATGRVIDTDAPPDTQRRTERVDAEATEGGVVNFRRAITWSCATALAMLMASAEPSPHWPWKRLCPQCGARPPCVCGPIVIEGRDGVWRAHGRDPRQGKHHQWLWAKCEQRVIAEVPYELEIDGVVQQRVKPVVRWLAKPMMDATGDVEWFEPKDDAGPSAWRRRNAFGDVGDRAEGRA